MNPSPSEKTIKKRYPLIDAIRGWAVVAMIAYHLAYDIFCVFGVYDDFDRLAGVVVVERIICCTFIIISGISVNFTSHGYRRGVIVNLCGFLVTAVTVIFIPSEAVWFGVLNLIGCSMLITYALRGVFNRIRPGVGMIASLLLFAFFDGLPEGYLGFFRIELIQLPESLYSCRYLAYLGLPDGDFFSADYFPLLPWIFLFFFGYFLWRDICGLGLDSGFTRKIPVLDFIGRHSLVIYLLHQPILYGVCYLILGR